MSRPTIATKDRMALACDTKKLEADTQHINIETRVSARSAHGTQNHSLIPPCPIKTSSCTVTRSWSHASNEIRTLYCSGHSSSDPHNGRIGTRFDDEHVHKHTWPQKSTTDHPRTPTALLLPNGDTTDSLHLSVH